MHVCRSFNVRHADSLPGLPARIPITSPRGILKVEEDRRKYIESIYAELNVAGEAMSSDAQRERVVEEARLAFAHNASVYVEQVAFASSKCYPACCCGLADCACRLCSDTPSLTAPTISRVLTLTLSLSLQPGLYKGAAVGALKILSGVLVK